MIDPEIVGIPAGSLSSDLRYVFDIGSFACPLIFEYTFQLHHRVSAELALYTINGVMQPFSILNRPGMYVSLQKTDNGKLMIYYMNFVKSNANLKGENDSISLRMYGIERVPGGFVELVNMINSKLEALAINLLGTWISRNGSAKLLKGDFDLLLPFDKILPSQIITHSCDSDPYAFLTLIRRKLLGCFFPLLEVPKEIVSSYFAKYCPGKKRHIEVCSYI